MITENGKTFYAECGDFDNLQIDDWLKDNVIEKLLLLQVLKEKHEKNKTFTS